MFTFTGASFRVSNFWQGPVGGKWLLVWAGVPLGADGSYSTGGIRVYSANDAGGATFVKDLLIGSHPTVRITVLQGAL